MKISLSLLLIILTTNLCYSTAPKLVLEFKKPILCQEAKSYMEGTPSVIECETSQTGRNRFYNVIYVGKKNVRIFMNEQKKRKELKDLTMDGEARPIQ